MKRYCAIDFDGVILRNHPVHTYVSHRCNMFVAKKLSVSLERAKEKNRELYTTTGHTLLGLKKLGVKTSLKEFNSFVYTELDYATVFKDMHLTHQEDIDGLDALLKTCRKEQITPFVFSNAPNVYVHNILKHMTDHPKSTIESQELISRLYASQHITRDLLKPDKDAYTAIERAFSPLMSIRQRNQELPTSLFKDYNTFIFVDDSLQNLLPTLIRPNWYGVHISPRAPVSSTFIHTTQSLRTLAKYLAVSSPPIELPQSPAPSA